MTWAIDLALSMPLTGAGCALAMPAKQAALLWGNIALSCCQGRFGAPARSVPPPLSVLPRPHMTLRRSSIWFAIAAVLVLSLNAVLIVLVKQAYEQVVGAQWHRQQSRALTEELQQEAEQLGTLVRAYTVTGKARYLTYYFDILAIRDGEKIAPANFNPATYWNEVIAGRIDYQLPTSGVKR